MLKALFALLLFASSAASRAADQVDVYDHAAGYRLFYSGCVVGVGSPTFNAECSGLNIAVNASPPPGNVTAFSSFPVMIQRVGAFVALWDLCYLTEAYGLPKGGIYFRIDCLTQAPTEKSIVSDQ